MLNERGIPSVTYGPGSKYCYWDEEFVPIDEYLTRDQGLRRDRRELVRA